MAKKKSPAEVIERLNRRMSADGLTDRQIDLTKGMAVTISSLWNEFAQLNEMDGEDEVAVMCGLKRILAGGMKL